MSLPIVEQIAVKIAARIAAVTQLNGYNSTVKEIHRPTTINGIKTGDMIVNMVQDDPTRSIEDDFPGNPPALAWNQPFELGLMLRPSNTDTIPLDTRINIFVADVVKGITTPQATWHNWDSLAILTDIGEPSAFGVEDDNGVVGILLPLTVKYRVAENDPYTAR